MTKQELSVKIMQFLDRCATLRADFDPEFDEECDKFSAPDSSMLYVAALTLQEDGVPCRVMSQWSMSGAYKGTSEDEKEHNEIIKELTQFY